MDLIKAIKNFSYWEEHFWQDNKSIEAWQQWRIKAAKEWNLDLSQYAEEINGKVTASQDINIRNTVSECECKMPDAVDELINNLAVEYLKEGSTTEQLHALSELITAKALYKGNGTNYDMHRIE